MVIPGKVITFNSVHSWQLYSAIPLEDLANATMIEFQTQSHYPGTELSSVFPILEMPGTRLCSEKCKFVNSLVWPDRKFNFLPSIREAYALPTQPRRPVEQEGNKYIVPYFYN